MSMPPPVWYGPPRWVIFAGLFLVLVAPIGLVLLYLWAGGRP